MIEVYRKKFKAEHISVFMRLYVMFYPQLVAGPIERPGNLIHQFYEEHAFDYQTGHRWIETHGLGVF